MNRPYSIELTALFTADHLVEELDINTLAEAMPDELRLDWIDALLEGISQEQLAKFIKILVDESYEAADALVLAIANSSTEDERKELVWRIAKL